MELQPKDLGTGDGISRRHFLQFACATGATLLAGCFPIEDFLNPNTPTSVPNAFETPNYQGTINALGTENVALQHTATATNPPSATAIPQQTEISPSPTGTSTPKPPENPILTPTDTPAASPTVIFSDTFDDGELGPHWVQKDGPEDAFIEKDGVLYIGQDAPTNKDRYADLNLILPIQPTPQIHEISLSMILKRSDDNKPEGQEPGGAGIKVTLADGNEITYDIGPGPSKGSAGAEYLHDQFLEVVNVGDKVNIVFQRVPDGIKMQYGAVEITRTGNPDMEKVAFYMYADKDSQPFRVAVPEISIT